MTPQLAYRVDEAGAESGRGIELKIRSPEDIPLPGRLWASTTIKFYL
jgi:hypothetical protein